jgi:hypothetical protein
LSTEPRPRRKRWIEKYDIEDGSFRENSNTGKAVRSQQHYRSIREQSTTGGASTGNKGGRVYASKLIDPTQSIEPLKASQTSSFN